MDIFKLFEEHSIIVEIKSPLGVPIGIRVECVSLKDDRVKSVERQIKNKALRGGRNSITAEKIERNTDEILAAAIIGWTWPSDLELADLKNPSFSKGNVLKLLSIGRIAEQIDEALGDDAAFFAKSGTGSPK